VYVPAQECVAGSEPSGACNDVAWSQKVGDREWGPPASRWGSESVEGLNGCPSSPPREYHSPEPIQYEEWGSGLSTPSKWGSDWRGNGRVDKSEGEESKPLLQAC